MIFKKGYTFKKVKTSHGSEMYVSRFGQVVKVIPFSSQTTFSFTHLSRVIDKIEFID